MADRRLEEIFKRVDFFAGIIGPVIDWEDADYLRRYIDAETKRREAAEAVAYEVERSISLWGGTAALYRKLEEWQQAKAEAEKVVNDAG